MRKLIALILVLAGLWSGYWYIGSTAKFVALETWLNDRRADGWTVAYSDFRVVGFPNRFDSRFTDLDLLDPRSGLHWQAPEFDILALSYQPNHIIAVWPQHQVLGLPLENIKIDSARMLASVVFEPDTKLAVARTSFETDDLVMASDSGWKMGIGKLHLSTRQHPGVDFAHDVIFDAKSVDPTMAVLNTLYPTGQLPKTIEVLFLDMTLGFDAPWDRIAVEQGAPWVTRITINQLDTGWGTLGLGGSGVLEIAASGEITGELALEFRNWRAVVDLFVTSGAIDRGLAETIKTGLGLLTGADATSLKTTLTLANGKMSLGPVPLGSAPRVIR